MILRETVIYTHRPNIDIMHQDEIPKLCSYIQEPCTMDCISLSTRCMERDLHARSQDHFISLITYDPLIAIQSLQRVVENPKKKLIYQFIHYTLLITISDCHIWSYLISRLHRPHALPCTSWPLAHNCSSANRRSVVFHHGLRLKTPCQASWQRRMNEGWKWKQWCRELSQAPELPVATSNPLPNGSNATDVT